MHIFMDIHFPSLCAKLYKKELLMYGGKYLDGIRFLGEDLILKTSNIKIINKPLFFYRYGGPPIN